MRYTWLLLLAVFLIPVTQSVMAQSVLNNMSKTLNKTSAQAGQALNKTSAQAGEKNKTSSLASVTGNATKTILSTIGGALKGSGEFINKTSNQTGGIIGKGIEGTVQFANKTAQSISKQTSGNSSK